MSDAHERAERVLTDADRRSGQITALQQKRLAAVLDAHEDAVRRLEVVRGVLGEVLVQDRDQGDPASKVDPIPLPAAGEALDPATVHVSPRPVSSPAPVQTSHSAPAQTAAPAQPAHPAHAATRSRLRLPLRHPGMRARPPRGRNLPVRRDTPGRRATRRLPRPPPSPFRPRRPPPGPFRPRRPAPARARPVRCRRLRCPRLRCPRCRRSERAGRRRLDRTRPLRLASRTGAGRSRPGSCRRRSLLHAAGSGRPRPARLRRPHLRRCLPRRRSPWPCRGGPCQPGRGESQPQRPCPARP